MTYSADQFPGGLDAAVSPVAADILVGAQGGDGLKFTLTQVAAVMLAVLRDTDVALAANSDSLFATQKAVKSFVEALVNGRSWKQSVRAASTGNGTLATAFENGDTLDGVTLATGDRILLKDQSSGAENGIYTVNASGAPTRAVDADTGAEMRQATVYVEEGSTNADKQFTCSTNAPITLGSTSLTFAQSGTGAVSDGDKGDVVVSSSGTVWTLDSAVTPLGVHAVPIVAGAMRPSQTGGCAALALIATTANQPDISSLDFDATTEEYAQFIVPMPKSWNEGTITAQFIWSHPSTSTNFGVVWGIQGVATSDGDAVAAAFGTAQTATDTGGTTNAQYISAATSAITIAGSPAAGDVVHFRVYRKAADGSDTMTVDARLHAVVLLMTTDAGNDA